MFMGLLLENQEALKAEPLHMPAVWARALLQLRMRLPTHLLEKALQIYVWLL